mgnify:CR=1 FL=1|tara:strand:+ start:63 stop:521 length:459 start_codon:yes stop_codon:yes gene_type:complete
MANKQRPRWSVSLTPIVELDAVADTHGPLTVLHEEIRQSIGGSGVIADINDTDLEAGGTWTNGSTTSVTSNNLDITVGSGVEVLYIKNTGKKVSDNSAADSTYWVTVQKNSVALFILAPGEAIVIPRPAADTWNVDSNSTNHVYMDWVTLGA